MAMIVVRALETMVTFTCRIVFSVRYWRWEWVFWVRRGGEGKLGFWILLRFFFV